MIQPVSVIGPLRIPAEEVALAGRLVLEYGDLERKVMEIAAWSFIEWNIVDTENLDRYYGQLQKMYDREDASPKTAAQRHAEAYREIRKYGNLWQRVIRFERPVGIIASMLDHCRSVRNEYAHSHWAMDIAQSFLREAKFRCERI